MTRKLKARFGCFSRLSIRTIVLLTSLFLVACGDEEVEIAGCTDPFSINYNADADIDDGSCTYSSVSFQTSQTGNFQIDSRFEESFSSLTVEINGVMLGEITTPTEDTSCTPSEEKLTYQFLDTDAIEAKYILVSEIIGSGQRTMRSKVVNIQRTQEACVVIDLIDEFDQSDQVIYYACNEPSSLNYNEEVAFGEVSCKYSKLIFYTPQTEGLDFGYGFTEDILFFALQLAGTTDEIGRIELPVNEDISDCNPVTNTIVYEFEGPDEVVFVYGLWTQDSGGSARTGRSAGLTFLPTQEECRVINILDYVP